MSKYIADTTVIIESFRNNKKAQQFLLAYVPCISDVTIAELIQGARDKKEVTIVLKRCSALSTIHIGTAISQKAIDFVKQYHLSHGLEILDAFIAATALENNLTLVTDNVRDFRYIKGLHILSQKEAFSLQ